jgi:hypothetical protein
MLAPSLANSGYVFPRGSSPNRVGSSESRAYSASGSGIIVSRGAFPNSVGSSRTLLPNGWERGRAAPIRPHRRIGVGIVFSEGFFPNGTAFQRPATIGALVLGVSRGSFPNRVGFQIDRVFSQPLLVSETRANMGSSRFRFGGSSGIDFFVGFFPKRVRSSRALPPTVPRFANALPAQQAEGLA